MDALRNQMRRSMASITSFLFPSPPTSPSLLSSLSMTDSGSTAAPSPPSSPRRNLLDDQPQGGGERNSPIALPPSAGEPARRRLWASPSEEEPLESSPDGPMQRTTGLTSITTSPESIDGIFPTSDGSPIGAGAGAAPDRQQERPPFAPIQPLFAPSHLIHLAMNDLTVISALVVCQQTRCCPFEDVAAERRGVELILAGMYVLAQRAGLDSSEATPQAVLTLLWTLMAFDCQYSQCVTHVLPKLCALHPTPTAAAAALRRPMLTLQREFLGRCDWNVRLDSTNDLEPAYRQLSSHPDWNRCVLHIKAQAVTLARPRTAIRVTNTAEQSFRGGAGGAWAGGSHDADKENKKRGREGDAMPASIEDAMKKQRLERFKLAMREHNGEKNDIRADDAEH